MGKRRCAVAALVAVASLLLPEAALAWRGRVVQFVVQELPTRREVVVGVITGVLGTQAQRLLDAGVASAAAAFQPDEKEKKEPETQKDKAGKGAAPLPKTAPPASPGRSVVTTIKLPKTPSGSSPLNSPLSLESSARRLIELSRPSGAAGLAGADPYFGRVGDTCRVTECAPLGTRLGRLSKTDWQLETLRQLAARPGGSVSLPPAAAPKPPEVPLCREGIAAGEAMRLGAIWDNGSEGVKRNPVAAADCYALAARLKNPVAAYSLGDMLLRGDEGVPRRPDVAIEWLRVAANADFAPAQSRLGRAYEEEALHRNTGEAFRWYSRAARAGDSWAQTRLSHFYLEGIGVKADFVQAFEWLNAAVAAGYGPARSAMDQLLPIVLDEADLGHPWGQHAKGLAYEHGVRGKFAPDGRKAFVAYRDALRQQWHPASEDMKRLCARQPAACG